MSIITDEMDRLKGIALGRFKDLALVDYYEEDVDYVKSKMFFELGYAYGMDDAKKIQEKIKVMAEEAVGKL